MSIEEQNAVTRILFGRSKEETRMEELYNAGKAVLVHEDGETFYVYNGHKVKVG